MVLYQNKFFLPKDSALITKVLTEFHASPQGGHTGALKTFKKVAEQIFWYGMRKQVQDFCGGLPDLSTNQVHSYQAAGSALITSSFFLLLNI